MKKIKTKQRKRRRRRRRMLYKREGNHFSFKKWSSYLGSLCWTKRNIYMRSAYITEKQAAKGKKKEERERERPLKTQSKEELNPSHSTYYKVGHLKVDKEGKWCW